MRSRRTLPSHFRFPPSSRGTILTWVSLTSVLTLLGLMSHGQTGFGGVGTAQAQTSAPTLSPIKVIVNSHLDGEMQADDGLTLREAIALTNGRLNPGDLSAAEKAQVSPNPDHSQIEFDLPSGQTTIRLESLLPTITNAGLVVDGTSQTGYGLADGDLGIPAPIVALTVAEEAEVFRGLTIAADQVQVRGLSLYGFTSKHIVTATTPPADIFIAHRLIPSKHLKEDNPEAFYPYEDERDLPPQGVVIESNWLGMPPQATDTPSARSAFGVSIYNAVKTRILNNRIMNHDGSAVISSIQAEQTEITNNVIEKNGLAGMPDAIRLEGKIDGTLIQNNQITKNAGSGIYLFKPEGAIMAKENQITGNGQRFRRAAVFLMGDDHHVISNTIEDQPGPGVVIASNPKSDRNIIEDNRFAKLDGLSIDLVARANQLLNQFAGLPNNRVDLSARAKTGVQDYQIGDGPNPLRNSDQRKRDTANRGINTPQFMSSTFYMIDGQVNLDGKADPGAQIVLYKVLEADDIQGPLSEPYTAVTANEEGLFAFTLTDAKQGDRLSAIAIHPDYGTSEPAKNIEIQNLARSSGK